MAAGRAPLGQMVLAQTAMELRLTLRRGESLLITLGIPLALLLFFGSIPVIPGGGDRQVEFLVPGILALAVMSTGMVSLGIATAFERQYGVLKRLGGSPLPRGGLLAAKMLAVLVIQLCQVGLLVGAAVLAFDWRPIGSPLLIVGTVLLGTALFSGLGLLLAGALRAEAVLAAANGLYLLFLLLGDMVVPLEQLPGWLATLARLLPAAAFASALRAAASEETLPLELLALSSLWTALVVALAARTFRWE